MQGGVTIGHMATRLLGVAFDPAFSFKKHVSNICRSAFYHIRDLRRIQIHLGHRNFSRQSSSEQSP